jgi:hypothetical protein
MITQPFLGLALIALIIMAGIIEIVEIITNRNNDTKCQCSTGGRQVEE